MRIVSHAFLACICLCAALTVAGQSEQNAQFTQGTPGTNTMTFQVPLGSFPGRGVDLPLNLNYNSRVWRIGFLKSRYWTPNGKNAVAEAIYSEFATAGSTLAVNSGICDSARCPSTVIQRTAIAAQSLTTSALVTRKVAAVRIIMATLCGRRFTCRVVHTSSRPTAMTTSTV